MPRTAGEYFGADVRKRAEKVAFGEIVKSSDTSDNLYQKLHDDYEERSTEARLRKPRM